MLLCLFCRALGCHFTALVALCSSVYHDACGASFLPSYLSAAQNTFLRCCTWCQHADNCDIATGTGLNRVSLWQLWEGCSAKTPPVSTGCDITDPCCCNALKQILTDVLMLPRLILLSWLTLFAYSSALGVCLRFSWQQSVRVRPTLQRAKAGEKKRVRIRHTPDK